MEQNTYMHQGTKQDDHIPSQYGIKRMQSNDSIHYVNTQWQTAVVSHGQGSTSHSICQMLLKSDKELLCQHSTTMNISWAILIKVICISAPTVTGNQCSAMAPEGWTSTWISPTVCGQNNKYVAVTEIIAKGKWVPSLGPMFQPEHKTKWWGDNHSKSVHGQD